MAFQELLLYIDACLDQEEFQSLKFLCMDLVPHKKLEKMESILDLFDELVRIGLLEESNRFIVSELLFLIGHHSLLKKLDTNRKTMEDELRVKQNVSSYRRMLYKLSENVATDDLRQIIFLLKLPSKYTENKTFLDILCYLEKNERIAEDNLDVLENAFCSISPDLSRMINDYKSSRVKSTAPVEEELEDLSKPPLSIQAVSPSDMMLSNDEEGTESIKEYTQVVHGLPTEKGLEAVNSLSALSLEDQPVSNFSEVNSFQTSMLMYSMNRKHRGYCLVINNSQFMRSHSRPGSEKDARNLVNVFTWLEFEVELCSEKTAEEMKDIMKLYQDKDHTDRDCFVCCILSHGNSGTVFGTDNEEINIRKIVSYFNTGNCKTLLGKPKLFFIQACQGQQNQNAHQVEGDAVSCADDNQASTIPEEADFLLGMSTVDGFTAYRHTTYGSWYIQALYSTLIKMVPRGEDILSILTQVNKDVSEKKYFMDNKGLLKQMPQPSYTLRKKLVFPKPRTQFKELQ